MDYDGSWIPAVITGVKLGETDPLANILVNVGSNPFRGTPYPQRAQDTLASEHIRAHQRLYDCATFKMKREIARVEATMRKASVVDDDDDDENGTGRNTRGVDTNAKLKVFRLPSRSTTCGYLKMFENPRPSVDQDDNPKKKTSVRSLLRREFPHLMDPDDIEDELMGFENMIGNQGADNIDGINAMTATATTDAMIPETTGQVAEETEQNRVTKQNQQILNRWRHKMHNLPHMLTEQDAAAWVLKKKRVVIKGKRHDIALPNRTNRTMLASSEHFSAMASEFMPKVATAMGIEENFQRRLLHGSSLDLDRPSIMKLLNIKESIVASVDGDDEDLQNDQARADAIPSQKFCPIFRGQKPPAVQKTGDIALPLSGPPLSALQMLIIDELRGYRHIGGAANSREPVVRMSEFRRNPYENFNLARAFAYNRVVHVGFLGHENKYDEAIACSSFRLAPYRSRSKRPISLCMNRVLQIADETWAGWLA
jgi:hypothetical protein